MRKKAINGLRLTNGECDAIKTDAQAHAHANTERTRPIPCGPAPFAGLSWSILAWCQATNVLLPVGKCIRQGLGTVEILSTGIDCGWITGMRESIISYSK